MRSSLRFAILSILLASSCLVTGQKDLLLEALEKHPELTIEVHASDPETTGLLIAAFPAEVSPRSKSLLLNITREELGDFLSLDLEYDLVETERDGNVISVFKDESGLPEGTWDQYPTYAGYVAMMNQFGNAYPQLCNIHSIKTLSSGRQLLVAQLGDNVGTKEAEPVFLYTSSIHGDETAGYVLMLRLIDYLLTSYGTDPVITGLMDSVEIWINPLANPDGTYYGGNTSVAQATRRNANSVDLNRNYPDPEDGPHPDGNPWQPETEAFMGFADTIPFTASANFHGGAEVFNYPWDTWSTLPADNTWWIMTGNEYADTAQYYSPSGYFNDFGSGVVNGYTWYSISGGRQDYMNYFAHCREVTIEMSSTKLLPSNQLEPFWDYNYRSFINYILQVTYGVHGIVRDSITHAPLRARVFIYGHDTDSSHVWSDPVNGDYHRLLSSGQYDISFSATGYQNKTIHGVQVQDYQQSWLTVDLVPTQPGFSESRHSEPFVFPQPAGNRLFIRVSAGDDIWSLRAIDGRTLDEGQIRQEEILELDVSRVPVGTYLVVIQAKQKTTTHRIVVSR